MGNPIVTVAPGSGESHGGAQVPLTVHVNLNGAAAGTYNSTLRIVDANADNSPHDVGVSVVVASPAALPQDFENADWDDYWIGDKGASAWSKITADKSHGTYGLRNLTAAGVSIAYCPSLVWARAGANLLVDVKDFQASLSQFDVLFGVQANNANHYGIRFFDGVDHDQIAIYKNSTTLLKTKASALPLDAWSTLTISWAANGTITWAIGGESDSVVDNSYTTGGIGIRGTTAAYKAEIDWFRSA